MNRLGPQKRTSHARMQRTRLPRVYNSQISRAFAEAMDLLLYPAYRIRIRFLLAMACLWEAPMTSKNSAIPLVTNTITLGWPNDRGREGKMCSNRISGPKSGSQ